MKNKYCIHIIAVRKLENIEEYTDTIHHHATGSILNPLAGKFSEDTERRVKARKQRHLMIGGDFICRNMIG